MNKYSEDVLKKRVIEHIRSQRDPQDRTAEAIYKTLDVAKDDIDRMLSALEAEQLLTVQYNGKTFYDLTPRGDEWLDETRREERRQASLQVQAIVLEVVVGLVCGLVAAQLEARLGSLIAILVTVGVLLGAIWGMPLLIGSQAGNWLSRHFQRPLVRLILIILPFGVALLVIVLSGPTTIDNFEHGSACWVRRDPQTQAVSPVPASGSSRVYQGQYALQLDVDLGAPQESKDHRGQIMYANTGSCETLHIGGWDRISAWLYVEPDPAAPSKPDDLEAEFFVQGPGLVWLASSPIVRLRPGEWVELTWDRSDPRFGAWDAGIDNFGIEIKSNLGYTGEIVIDYVTIKSYTLASVFE
jgi:hypothetical protein